MHRIVLVLTCLALTACSQAQHATAPALPDPAPSEESAPVVMAVPEEAPAQPPTPGEKPAMPGVPLDDLIGMEDEAVKALIGEPNRREDRAPATAWIYDGTGCAFGLLLYPDLETNRRTVLSYETDEPGSCTAPMVLQ